jgi:tetratricopeptide (TPR) repeat protein
MGWHGDPLASVARKSSVRKLAVLVLGAIGLAGALTLAAFAAPSRKTTGAATYLPTDPATIVATVPERDAAELAARKALVASPEDVELAVSLARADLDRYRRFSDPRYLGRAQATLARWWKQTEPPADVQLLRATILQSTHEFGPARRDLDALVRRDPKNLEAHLTRAVVATITADYAAARESCAALDPGRLRATCEAPLDGIAGRAADAYARLAVLDAHHGHGDAAVRGWTLSTMAELAIMLGRFADAERHLNEALVLDRGDVYARNLLADILMATNRLDEAAQLLEGREQIDSHLVRLAILEHQRHGAEAPRLVAAMRERIAAAAARGDRIHLREEARFALAVDGDRARALQLAIDNWNVQKELADARLLAETAAAARNPAAAEPVVSWMRETGVRDAWLQGALR